MAFDRKSIRKAGREPDDIFFRGLAYRLMWNLYWNFNLQVHLVFTFVGGTSDDEPSLLAQGDLLLAFNQAESDMLVRHVLEDDQGVLYRGKDREILWAFSSFDFHLKPNRYARNLITGESVTAVSLAGRKVRGLRNSGAGNPRHRSSLLEMKIFRINSTVEVT